MKYSVFYHHVLSAAKELFITPEEMLLKINGYGIGYVELDRNEIGDTDEKITAFSNMLSRCGIKPSNICGYYNFNILDEVSENDLMIHQALMLGCKRIMVIPGFYSDLSDREKCLEEKQRMISGTKKLVEKASLNGLTVTVECYDNKGSPISTIGGIKDFLDAVPELYVTLETGNFIYSGEDILSAFEVFRDRIRHVHLKDRYLPSHSETDSIPVNIGSPTKTVTGEIIRACAVGHGHIPIKDILKKLFDIGYDGIYTIEHFGAASYEQTIHDSIIWLKDHEN